MTEIPTDNKNLEDVEDFDQVKQIVNGIFKKINHNSDIPDAVKDCLKGLRQRIMDIAITTPNLFAFDNHQVRVFLDSACKTSIEWAQMEDNHGSYLKKLDFIVNKINQQQEYDNKQFIQFQKDLDNSLMKLKKRATVRLKRKLEKQLAQQKIAKAKQETSKIISEKLLVLQETDDFMNQIPLEEWNNVLVLLQIRNGQDSEIYQSNLSFVDLLLEILIDKVPFNSSHKNYKALITKYKTGLSLVAFNKLEIVGKVGELMEFLKTINNPEQKLQKKSLPVKEFEEIIQKVEHEKPIKPKLNKVQKPRASKQVENTREVSLVKPKSSSEVKNQDKDYTKIVAELKNGTWFEIIEAEKTVKAKLSWVSPITGNHLFVDLSGLKVATKTSDELIQELTNKTLKII